jgi:hypothetical protein
VRIPQELLHVAFDGLEALGVGQTARTALRELLADLPAVPDAKSSAQLIGPPAVSLPCLAVLARHVGQGLRDHNLGLAHDKTRLRAERLKLMFLDADALLGAPASGDQRPLSESALFVTDYTPALLPLLAQRDALKLVSFVTSTIPIPELAHWRTVNLPQYVTHEAT